MAEISLKEKYSKEFDKLLASSKVASKIDETNTYQLANPETRVMMDTLVRDHLLPESHLEGVENFEKFCDLLAEGKSGLILMEHYSNTDYPAFVYMLENSGNEKLADMAKKVVAVAGMKLNEANPCIRAFAESFTRVVIYPTRSLDSAMGSKSEEEAKAEELKARKINLSAMRSMDKCKRNGQPILVFPSGTRYRPGYPETKKGLREIDSYLRLFDYVLLVSVHGEILKLRDEDMLNDLIAPAKQVFSAREVIECKPFRKAFMESLPADEPDPKQKMIDHVMELLDELHEETEKKI